MSQPQTRTPAKVNYLNNRDILKEIHLSKNSYCSFLDPVADHQYDIILPTVGRINQKTVAEARRNRADRIRRETGVEQDPKKIPNTKFIPNFFEHAKQCFSGTGFGGEKIHAKPIV